MTDKERIKKLEEAVNQTGVKDMHGNMIKWGDTLRFANKAEWYKIDYLVDLSLGNITKEDMEKDLEKKPYYTKKVECIQDYEWLLSSEIQMYWEIVK